MKKVLVLLMIGVLLFSISACADDTQSGVSSDVKADINTDENKETPSTPKEIDIASSEPAVSEQEEAVSSVEQSVVSQIEETDKSEQTLSEVKIYQPVRNKPSDPEKLGVTFSTKKTAEIGEITVEKLSEILGLEVDTICYSFYRDVKIDGRYQKELSVVFKIKNCSLQAKQDYINRFKDNPDIWVTIDSIA